MEDYVKRGGLPWTGERYLPSVNGVIELEHVHRYLMAKELAKGRDVLDIASGEGYGSAMLAKVARTVVGVDNSEQAIAHAEHTYIQHNLEYKLGSCEAIPLPDACVDLVVSFETIEHHDQHEAMMLEIKRVLRPEGVLIISSPDKYEYSVVTKYRNPYHVKELYRQEFEELVSSHFRNVTYLGQRVVCGSAILHKKRRGSIVSFRRDDDRIVSSEGIPRPVYLIAVASEAEIPDLSSGLFVQAIDEMKEGIGLDMTEWSSALSRITAERDALLVDCARIDEELAGLYDSVSWRITRPIRWVGSFLARVRREIGRLAHLGYEVLPLSMDSKLKLKSRVFLTLGPLLKDSQSYKSWQDFEKKRGLEGSRTGTANPLGRR